MADSDQHFAAEEAAIRASGLFFSSWYLAQHPEIAARGEDGVEHFCRTGWRIGAAPNPYFSPAFYLATNPDVAASGFNPLLHYLGVGDFEGRNPCAYFQVKWYRATYGLGPRELCLGHFLQRHKTGQVNPVPFFDGEFYLEENPDVAAAGADPFEHFLLYGAAEGRNPSPGFDTRFYANRYADQLAGQNPLLHYINNLASGEFVPLRPDDEILIPGQVKLASRPSAYFEEFRPVAASAARKAQLLAFYLPQFHRVPENDAWWGKGFTDWTNVARAVPRFAGHLQPRIPRDLGFYSLDDPTTLSRQIELAKNAGLAGFVFYFYWFNRQRLLDAPLEQVLGDATLDFPFCVMWANENWTRRWDGLENEVLISQSYNENDDAALVACFARLFADPRYIRVQRRPLLMIYRVTLIPNAARRIRKWRDMFRARHNEDPVIIMAQSLGDYDPAPYGLDGAVEFPPHKLSPEAETINDKLNLLDPDFSAAVFAYDDIAAVSLATPKPEFPLIKTIVPGWDNDPRREGKGLVLHGATPAKYQQWLEKLVDYANKKPFFDEPIICVNAWNEWAEGAFLEPDVHFGGAFLNATSRALCDRNVTDLTAGILLVGHDAQAHGSQMLLLHIARQLRRQWGIDVHLLLLGVGPLMGKYHETARVTVAYDKTIIGKHLDKYHEAGIRTAIVNTAAAARVVPWLADRGIAATLLIHEMPNLLHEYNLEIQARLGAITAKNLIFSSDFVRRAFDSAVDLPDRDAATLPQGNYKNISFDPKARERIRRELNISAAAFMVLGVGFADLRKGFDLFMRIASQMAQSRKDVHFVWVGDIQFALKTYFAPEIEKAKSAGWFHHIGFTDAVADYYAAADVYALTSREDPYPTVVLEALACGVPCVAFDESGGIPELLRQQHAGLVAPPGDTDAFLAHIMKYLDHKKLNAGRQKLTVMAAQKFDFRAYTETLLRIAQPKLKTVSVCVLNYNYARYLAGRLGSVFAQTYPVREVLFLDDASSDDSVTRALQIAQDTQRDMRVIANDKNAGSVFAQWRRAAESASGDYIWIAEADDESTPDFLSRLIEAIAGTDTSPLLAFTDSRAIDANGRTVTPSYKSYYLQSGAKELSVSGIWQADEFARRFLSERNLILNASAVLWRRDALLAALDRCGASIADWRIAGDWRLYLEVLAGQPGSAVYLAEPLNVHRRHQQSATQSLHAADHVNEIAAMHEIAGKALRLDAAAKAGQADYLNQIKTQLGVSATGKAKTAAKRGKA